MRTIRRMLLAVSLLFILYLSTDKLMAADDDVVTLDTVVVGADSTVKDGSADRGYRVEVFESLGPLGDREILDTPYSMFGISSDIIESTVVGNIEQVFKMNPLGSRGPTNIDINSNSSIGLRGFSVSSTFVDGIKATNEGQGMFLEDKEKVEIYAGLSGFLFGADNVGGVINYVTKRPTSYFLNKVTAGYRSGTSFYGHADIGGPIMNGKFGYRFNVMYQGGDTDIDGQDVSRRLGSGAFDWNPTDKLKVQFNATYNKYHVDGRQGMFNLSVISPDYWHDPVDSTKLYAPENTYHDVESYNLGTKVNYHLNETFDFRASYSRKSDIRKMFYATGQRFIMNRDQYGLNLMLFDRKWTNDGVNAYADARFNTGDISHKVTFGGDLNYNIYEPVRYKQANGSYATSLVTSNVGGLPLYIFPLDQQPTGTPGPESLFVSKEKRVKYSSSFSKNLMVGDEVKFTEQWIVLAGLNLANIETKNYNATTEVLTSEYDKSALTPAVSLMYKPLSNITAYGTYIEALEEGPRVGMDYTNAGEIMEPVRSNQYEIGLKAEALGLLSTLALFKIERASTMDRINPDETKTLVKDGRQVNRGVEFTLSGKLLEDLTLMGGFTYIDAEVRKSNTPALNGTTPRGVPEYSTKLYSEYDLPFAKGLTLTGGIYYVGSVWLDNNNTGKSKAYTTGDLGLRYTTKRFGPETTFRTAFVNITDERYWIASDPGNVQVGPGRKVYCSMTVGF